MIQKEFCTDGLNAYSGYYLDRKKLLQSASGGGASAIAEAIINEGGVVFGVCYTPDFKNAEFACIENINDLYKIKGSKYIETQKRILQKNGEYKSVYSTVAEKLQSGVEVLFIGLGCDVAALYSFLKGKDISTSSLYTADLICMGSTSSEVAKQYINFLEKKYKSKVVDFSVRYKKQGWLPIYIFTKFENGKTFTTKFHDSDYGYAFSHYYVKKACCQCEFKGHNHVCDLTLGDYWGITKDMNGYNPDGVSIFITRTKHGEQLINKIDRTEFLLQKTDVAFAIANNPMYYLSRKQEPKWKQFHENLYSKGLHYAVIADKGVGVYMRSFVSKLCPTPVKSLIKKIITR